MKFKRLKESYNSDFTYRLNSMNEELSNIEIRCRDKFKELETILLSGQNADVENNIKKAFKAVNGKVWFKEKSPRYLMFDGKVGDYTLRNSVHIEYLKGDLTRLAEDLIMAYNVLLGGEREYTPNFVKRILNSTNVSESKNSLKESSDDTYYNSVIQDLESIESFLRKENFTSFDVSDYDVYPMQTSVISFVVEGDWKHEHQLFKNLLYKWSQETGRDIFKIDEQEVGDSDSDWYTSIYKVFITKDEDTMNTLNSMRGLFEAQDSYFTKSNDESSYEALSALRNFKKTAEYGDSIKLDVNGEKVNIQKEYDGWYLTCSKARVKGPYKHIEATVKDLANGRFNRLDDHLNEDYTEDRLKRLISVQHFISPKDRIQLFTTPKGNYEVRRNGKKMMILDKKNFRESEIEDLRLNGYFDDYDKMRMNESLKESYVPVTLDRIKDAPYSEDIYSTNPHGIIRIKTDHGYTTYTKRKKNYWVRTTGSMSGYEEFNDKQIFDLAKNNKNAEIWVEPINESLNEDSNKRYTVEYENTTGVGTYGQSRIRVLGRFTDLEEAIKFAKNSAVSHGGYTINVVDEEQQSYDPVYKVVARWRGDSCKLEQSSGGVEYVSVDKSGYRWKIKESLTEAKKKDIIDALRHEKLSKDGFLQVGDAKTGWTAQIQDQGALELDMKYNSSKLKSGAWGRIWKNKKLVKQFNGPVNVVRDQMIKFFENKLLEQLKEDNDSSIEKYDPNTSYADRYRVKVANCKCPLCNSASLKLVDYVDDYVVCDNCGAELESVEKPNGSITFKTWEYDYTPDPNHENDFEISYGKEYDPDFRWDEDDLELVSDELNAGQWLESLKEDFSTEEKRRDFINALKICQAYDPYTEYIENGRQQKYKEELNNDLNKEFKEIMSKYGIYAYSVPTKCTYAHCRTDRDFIDALKKYVNENRMTSKEIVEALNELDNKAINEDTTFYDLKNLYEANELKAEDRRRLADAIRNGDDPVLIATFLSSKLKDDVDEDFIDTDPLDDDKQLLNEYTIDEDFDEDLGFLEDYLDDYEIPDVISETEIVETEMPSQGEDIGLSDMILDSIQSSAEKIREYNSLSANLGEHEEDLKDVLEDISVNENETLGKLQSMLKVVSPNAENIMDGAVEAEELIEVE